MMEIIKFVCEMKKKKKIWYEYREKVKKGSFTGWPILYLKFLNKKIH